MLKKENRLKKNKQFNYIYKHGEARHSKFLSIVFLQSKYKPLKVGFTVSKKIGKSVVRNKVKRRLRDIIKLNINRLNPNFNYIIIAREGVDKLTYLDLKQQMISLLLKANLYV